jgi:uncharacterized membrane protein
MSFSVLFPPLRGKCRRKAFGGPTMGVYKRHQIKSFWLRIWPSLPICLWKRIRGLKMSFSDLFPPLRGKCRRKAFGGPTMGVYKRHQIKSFWLRIWPFIPICLWKRIRGLKMSFSDLFPPLRGKCRRKAFGGPTMGVYKRHQIKSFWLRIWPFLPICLR